MSPGTAMLVALVLSRDQPTVQLISSRPKVLLYLVKSSKQQLIDRHIPPQRTFVFRTHIFTVRPHSQPCSLFPSTLSHPILNHSSNRALALSPGRPLCSHRSCCPEDRVLLISSPHFPPVQFTVGLSAALPEAVTSPLLPQFFEHLPVCSDLLGRLFSPLLALLPL